MTDFPAMPLWTDAYLADTRHLSDAEHGRYMLMLIDMWRMPEKRFPNDDQWLARKFRRPVAEIVSDFRPLIVEFFTVDGTCHWICQKRLAREWHRLRRTTQRQSENAKSGWRKRKAVSHGNAALALQPEPEPYHPTYIAPSPEADASDKRAKNASRLSEEWRPSADDTAYARNMNIDPARTLQDFRDYWLSKPGKDGLKLDWSRTWQTWCRNAADRQARLRAGREPPRQLRTGGSRIAELMAVGGRS